MNRISKRLVLLLGFGSIVWSLNSMAESSQVSGQGEWDKTLELAKREE